MYNRHFLYFQLFLRFSRELSGTLIDRARNNEVGGLSNWFVVICKTQQVFLKQYETRISSRSSHDHLSHISHPSHTHFSPISHQFKPTHSQAGLTSRPQVFSSYLKPSQVHPLRSQTDFNLSLVCYTVHILEKTLNEVYARVVAVAALA